MLSVEKPAEIVIPYAGAERVLLAHVDDVAQMIVALVRTERMGHGVYNTPCELVLVEELKNEIERMNSNIFVKIGTAAVKGNPYHLDSQRFEQEFEFKVSPIFDHLRQHASKSES
jgi:nucleoside-diphosphate-sugar epimerase